MYDQSTSTSTVFEARPKKFKMIRQNKEENVHAHRMKSCTCSQLLSNLLWDRNILLHKLITVQDTT